MEFTAPASSGFTVYGKTSCSYCGKVKDLLTDYAETFIYVNCDDYLLEHREAFLEYIEKLAGKEYRTFPMVFFSGEFVGGYMDTMKLMLDTHDNK
jgi:glutaredoxin